MKNGLIWVSGTEGTILRSLNNGQAWQECATPPDAGKLDFRGVRAFSKDRAIVMSSGPSAASRLYETTDGCYSWHLLLTNPDPNGFWDAIRFQGKTGVLLGDPVENQFVIYKTFDEGRHWTKDESPVLAASPKGEGAFAASNSSLVIRSDGKVLFGTGGLGGPRVFLADLNKNGNWTAIPVPLASRSESAGVFSLAFRDNRHGIAVGGDYKNPGNREGTAAFTTDGGITWQVAATPPSGYRSSVEWYPQAAAWITAGTNGSDISTDDGRSWRPLESVGGNALSMPWVVGAHGDIHRLRLKR